MDKEEKDLVAQFLKEHPEVLDDDIEDKFNSWLEEQEVTSI